MTEQLTKGFLPVPQLLNLLGALIFQGTIRTSSRAVALRCIAHVAATYCYDFCKYFFADSPTTEQMGAEEKQKETAQQPSEGHSDNLAGLFPPLFAKLLELVDFPDPLIRGNVAQLIGSFIKGFLSSHFPLTKPEFERMMAQKADGIDDSAPEGPAVETKAIEKKGEGENLEQPQDCVVDLVKLIEMLLSRLDDESANTSAMACRALRECFPTIADSHLALTMCTDILEHIFRRLKSETYWLVKTEV